MEDKAFVDKLLYIERELLALKTAQERGLGAMSFYRYTTSKNLNDPNYLWVNVTATIKADALAPAFVQLGLSPLEGFTVPSSFVLNNDRVYVWTFVNPASYGMAQTIEVECITASELQSLTVEYTNDF